MGHQSTVRCSLPFLDQPTLERFWSNVETVDDCWVWRGPTVNGHPQAHLRRRPVRIRMRAYIVAWEIEHGPFTGQLLLPECENDLCIRPLHRSPATKADLPHNSDERRIAEFWAKCEPGPDGCLLWKGGRIAGGRYGVTTWHGKSLGTHRLAWQLKRGPIPDGMFVCHSCDNPPCVNVDHLFLGAPADNSADMVRKGRSWSPGGLAAWNAKLTADQVAHIRDLYHRCGISAAKLGDIYGVSTMAAWHVAVGNSYRDLPMPKQLRPRKVAG